MVLLADGSPMTESPLTRSSPEYVGGDDSPDNGVLNPGESWEWQVTVNPTATVTYTAIGHGTDIQGNDVTWCEEPGSPPANTVCDQDEKDEVTVTVEYPEPCIEVTKDVNCGLSKPGDMVTYEICIENCGDSNIVEIVSMVDTKLGDLTALMNAAIGDGLEPEDVCCITIDHTIPAETDEDPYDNEVTVTAEDEYSSRTDPCMASASVDLVHPAWTVDKDCTNDPLPVPSVAIFNVRVENTGDVCLHFDLDDLGDPCGFDLAPLAVKEWETHYNVDTPDDVENRILGTVTLVPECGDPCDCLRNEYDVNVAAICEVGGEATRTWGFWKTHYYIAEYVFDNCADTDPNLDLGWTTVENIDEVMGIFWGSKAKMSKLCQARLQASHQAIAAILNNCMPDGAAIPNAPCDIAATLGGCDIDAIKDLGSDLAAYNESGDDVEVVLPPGLTAYNAQPKYAREQAVDFSVSDCEGGCAGASATGGKGPKK